MKPDQADPIALRQVDLRAGEVRHDAGTTKNHERRLFPLTDDLPRLFGTTCAATTWSCAVLGYFSLRAAHALGVAAGRAIDPDAERELDDWRRLVLRQSAIFGLLPDSDDNSRDAIPVRAEHRRLYALFNLPEGWIPSHRVERASHEYSDRGSMPHHSGPERVS